jgi:hypothetical protein
VVIAALLLAACATRGVWVEAAKAASAGDWQISRKVDSVTGARLTNVLLPSSKTAHSGLRYTPRALLQFACLKGQPVVHLQFAFRVGSKGDSDVSYRFDKEPSHSVKARFLRGLKIVLIEDKSEVAQFMDGLATANVLHLTISSMAKGRTSAEFRVAGAPAVIEMLRAGCH